jgi:hypothetical protein
VLDTSLTWVAGGITGSQAFAAFDRGFDVWLGTSRSNPPHEAVGAYRAGSMQHALSLLRVSRDCQRPLVCARCCLLLLLLLLLLPFSAHTTDPQRRGSAYWLYTNNEVGVYDMGAQLDHIHAIKMRELAGHSRSKSSSSSRRGSRAAAAAASGSGGRRSSSSSAQPVMQQQQQAGGGSSGHRDILAELLGGSDYGSGAAAAGGVPSVVFDVSEGGLEGAGGRDGSSTPAAAGSIQQLQRATSSGGDSNDDVYQPAMSRTPSAAEIDEAAAAEAAEALSRHRAAMAAAGVAAPAAAQQQDGAAPHPEPATPRQQGVLLTPTAAAARAASALGSAIAAAAAAASDVVGAAASSVAAAAGGIPRADADGGGGSDSSADGCHVHVTAHGVSLGSCDAADAADDLARSSGNAATTVLTGASGLFERLLGGTTPLSSSNGALPHRDGSRDAQQQQQQLEAYQAQHGMRHSTSAPDVSAAAAADALGRAGSLAAGASPAVEQPQQQQQHASGGAAAGSSSSGRGRIRRGSWPWSPAVAAGAADKLGAQRQETPVESAAAAAAAAAAAGESPTAATMASPFGREPQQGAQEEQLLQQQASEEQQPCASSSSEAAGMADAAASCSSRLASTASTASSIRWDRAAAARPYNLQVVAHSLGGFLALIYTTQRARAGRPHHVSRLILLSPAGVLCLCVCWQLCAALKAANDPAHAPPPGYHPVIPTLFKPLVYVWRPFMAVMHWVWRQQVRRQCWA